MTSISISACTPTTTPEKKNVKLGETHITEIDVVLQKMEDEQKIHIVQKLCSGLTESDSTKILLHLVFHLEKQFPVSQSNMILTEEQYVYVFFSHQFILYLRKMILFGIGLPFHTAIDEVIVSVKDKQTRFNMIQDIVEKIILNK